MLPGKIIFYPYPKNTYPAILESDHSLSELNRKQNDGSIDPELIDHLNRESFATPSNATSK